MLYHREKILLSLLEQLGEPISSIKLQKLLFILCDRLTTDRPYDFIPYKYGCYSFQAHQDLIHLANANILTIDDSSSKKIYELSSYAQEYHKMVDRVVLSEIEATVSRFGTCPTPDLVKYTYINYPFFAINSQILNDFFSESEIKNIKSHRPSKTGRTLFTIGYEGVSLEKYILDLIKNDIHVLCDVRKNAYSQKFGFSKSILKKSCEGVGIEYVHIPDLGIVSEKRRGLKTLEDYNSLFDEYERTVLQSERNALNYLFLLLQSRNRIALTCFEHESKYCHRSRIAKKLMSTSKCNYNLIDL